ncbi:MAG: hypothetical protein K6F32_04150 [Bacilli bacterium]|nr:hypothetical protein [Bacilli bacterium]
MFGKKEQPPVDKSEIDRKFRTTLRGIQRTIDGYEEKIQAEFDNAVNYRKAGNIDEESRCMRKISRLMAAKIQKEEFYDNVEQVQERIDDMLDQAAVSRTLADTYSGLDNLVDSREMKSIVKQLEGFNKTFAKAGNMMDAFMSTVDSTVSNNQVSQTYSPTVQAMLDQRMKSVEQRIEEKVEQEQGAASMFTL